MFLWNRHQVQSKSNNYYSLNLGATIVPVGTSWLGDLAPAGMPWITFLSPAACGTPSCTVDALQQGESFQVYLIPLSPATKMFCVFSSRVSLLTYGD